MSLEWMRMLEDGELLEVTMQEQDKAIPCEYEGA